jgi:hypothetical protein
MTCAALPALGPRSWHERLPLWAPGTLKTIAAATGTMIWEGSSFPDRAPDWSRFTAYDEAGRVLDVRTIEGYHMPSMAGQSDASSCSHPSGWMQVSGFSEGSGWQTLVAVHRPEHRSRLSDRPRSGPGIPTG